MMREAAIGDEPKIEKYLAQHYETTMFMRGNLRDFGLGNTVAPYAMRYFLSEENGVITGVCGLANFGTMMVQAGDCLSELAKYIRAVLPENFECKGFLGAPEQIKVLRDTFDLAGGKTIFDEVEPLFSLSLKDLIIPEVRHTTLRNTTEEDRQMLIDWGYDYMVETGLGLAGKQTRIIAEKDAENRIKSDGFRILMFGEKPVAQTGLNAVLPDCVQIGGVYTPPAHRGLGFARRAVALHLAEIEKTGVQRAILFSASIAASRAYRAIGFCQVGTYVITLFDDKD